MQPTGTVRLAASLALMVIMGCGSILSTVDAGSGPDADAAHDAGGEACAEPTCPVVLATDVGARELAVDDADLVWTNLNDGTLRRMSVDGGNPGVLATSKAGPYAPVLRNGTVYWRENYALWRTALDGGTSTMLVSDPSGVRSFAVDDASVYWSNGVDAIQKEPLTGGAPTVLASNQPGAEIALDATDLYWTSFGALMKMPVGGGQPTLLFQVQSPTGLSLVCVKSSTIYFEYYGPGPERLAKIGVDGGTPTDVITLGSGYAPLTMDGVDVYWAPYQTGLIEKAPVDGGATITMASAQVQPASPAVNSTSLFWIDVAKGTILELEPK